MCANFYPERFRFGSTRAKNLFLSKSRARPSLCLGLAVNDFTLLLVLTVDVINQLLSNLISADSIIMRPSSLGGGRILRRTLSVRLSVCLSVRLSVRPVSGSSFVIVYITTVLRANIQNRKKTSVFDYRPATRM